MASPADIPALVRHLRGGSKAQQLRAATGLKSLARQGASSSEAIVNAGGIAALVSCLQHSSSTAVSKAAALALVEVSHSCPMGVGNFAPAAAAIPTLVCMLADSSRPELQQAAFAALSNLLVRSEELIPAAAEAGAIPAVVQLLRSCSPVPYHVAGLAGRLVDGSAARSEAFAAAGGVTALVRCLPAAAAEEQAILLVVLGNLALSSQRSRQAIARAGGVALLAQLFKDSPCSNCQSLACNALANLALCSDDVRVAILAADVMPAAVQLLTSSQPESQGSGACLIRNLCASESGVQAQQVGAIPALLRVLGEGNPSNATLLQAAQAVNNLASHSATTAALLAAGAVPILQQLARSTTSQDVRDVARDVLSYLEDMSPSAAPTGLESAGAAAAQPSEAAPQPPTTCAAPGCANTQRLRRCGGCRSVRYCGEACRNAHWREHRAECRRLRAGAPGGEAAQPMAAA